MTAISITQIYDYLAPVFGKETAEKMILFLEQKINIEMENKSQLLVTKEDLLATKEYLNFQILTLREDLRKEVSRLDLRISETKADLTKEIANVKGYLIKWMFIFWIGQAGISIGLILHFLKK